MRQTQNVTNWIFLFASVLAVIIRFNDRLHDCLDGLNQS